ncbi:MAG: hypothetical protein HND58_07565 [Planctomycetota bacterium]|nr:MAG: hypothetical protein HND58_07565 [Planctomycetota bacterium]
MPLRLFELYQRKRIVNINLNILASGLLAVILAKPLVVLVGNWIGPERLLSVTLAAGAVDMVVDVIIYYALHWFANHWNPPWKRARDARHKRSFFRDASVVQFERAILSPLYYLVAMGLMYALQHRGMAHGWAFVVGFASGLLVTRVVHTVWGMRSGRFLDLTLPAEEICPDADASPPAPDRSQP